MVQFIKKDESGNKTKKIIWDDHRFNPQELIEDIWNSIPELKEGVEIPDGIFRKQIASYQELVVRELLANAIVHKPYNTGGHVFINLYPDRLNIVNPGPLPIGVTPSNILHQTIQRNEHLAKLFYTMKLMEQEGSGYDKIYESLLSAGKPLPEIDEHDDRVSVTIKKRIIDKDIINFMDKANQEFNLSAKELISLGLIAQHESLTAFEFSTILSLKNDQVQHWLGNLIDYNLIQSRGRTKGKKYFVNKEYLRKLEFTGKTSLRNIESHRLRELIIQDVKTHGESAISDINERIGPEIRRRSVRAQINILIEQGRLYKKGRKKGTKYFIDK